jgi:NADH-quinone oxidoreductase subunit A
MAMPNFSNSPVISDYGFVALILIMTFGLSLLAAGLFLRAPRRGISAPPAWAQRRFGFVVYALIFLAFDMEMIFMYPWAVVFADIGISAFLDMLVFIVLLSAGIAYAWGMGGLKWE